MYKNDAYKKIYAKFVIPKPDKKSILMSKKLQGGVLMDMGPYISSIPRLFDLKKFHENQLSHETLNTLLILKHSMEISSKVKRDLSQIIC